MIYLSGSLTFDLPVYAGYDWFKIGLLVQPGTASLLNRVGRFPAWALDNGCFNDATFDETKWWETVQAAADTAQSPATDDVHLHSGGECLSLGDTLAFVVAPDVVGNARATLQRSAPWLRRIRQLGLPPAFVAQDGSESGGVPWGQFSCLFIGGSTDWKMSRHALDLCNEARRRRKWVHVGRVNSHKRFLHFAPVADSADGTFLAFGPQTNLPKMLRWLEHNGLPTALYEKRFYEKRSPRSKLPSVSPQLSLF